MSQLTQIERRQTRIRSIYTRTVGLANTSLDPIANTPESHHHIGQSQNNPEDVSRFVRTNRDDLAMKVSYTMLIDDDLYRPFVLQDFLLKLKAHLLPRARTDHGVGVETLHPSTADLEDGGESLNQLSYVVLKGNRIFRHYLLRINYTTYDVRRKQDVINTNTDHNDVMLLSRSTEHPFSYARVLGIFHANVMYLGPGSGDHLARRIEFLWVRWLELAKPAKDGLTLDTLRFLPMVDPDAFGFVDPADVLRGCHLIPAFEKGHLHPDLTAMSHIARDGSDWKEYYVNR